MNFNHTFGLLSVPILTAFMASAYASATAPGSRQPPARRALGYYDTDLKRVVMIGGPGLEVDGPVSPGPANENPPPSERRRVSVRSKGKATNCLFLELA